LNHSRESHYADGGILFSFENLHIVIKLISKEFFDSGAEQNRVIIKKRILNNTGFSKKKNAGWVL